jgi:anaerobic ribonucleoside-triphosphate reductase activating protein
VTSLRVAQVVARTAAEGPGERFAVWVQGCPIRCPGCCNPHMFATEGGTVVAAAELARRAAETPDIEGVSLLGGEPFAQAEGSARFASLARASGLSVMVFTGYTLAELEARSAGAEAEAEGRAVKELLEATDLLVDGRFERDALDTTRRWIGSKNQVLHFRTKRYDPSDPRLSGANTAEIRLTRTELTMNGWPGLLPHLKARTPKRGSS